MRETGRSKGAAPEAYAVDVTSWSRRAERVEWVELQPSGVVIGHHRQHDFVGVLEVIADAFAMPSSSAQAAGSFL